VNQHIDDLVEKTRAIADLQSREAALELAQSILDLHAQALERVMEVVAESDGGAELIGTLAADPTISGVLLLHDLHPLDLPERVERALADPLFHRAGATTHLISTEDGVVRVRVRGGHIPRSDAERVIWDAAPDARDVIVEGIPHEFAPGAFVPLEQLLMGSA